MGKRLSSLFWVAALALVFRACALEPVRVMDESMSPALQEGDVVLVSRLHYGLRVPGAGAMVVEWRPPRRGDLVVAVSVGDPPMSLLRRITAEAGDRVAMPDGKERTLQEGEFFLTAEQKEALDGRKLGPTDRRSIIGKAIYVWPAKRPSAGTGSRVESPKPVWKVLRPL